MHDLQSLDAFVERGIEGVESISSILDEIWEGFAGIEMKNAISSEEWNQFDWTGNSEVSELRFSI